MDINRAKQIVNASEKINVLYQGSPVWIEGISEDNIAEVTSLSGRKTKMEIPVSLLEEREH